MAACLYAFPQSVSPLCGAKLKRVCDSYRRHRQSDRHIDIHIDRQTDSLTDRQIDRQTDSLTDRHVILQTDR